MALVVTDRLIFCADSKVRVLVGNVAQVGIGSKITVYASRRGNVVIGHAGMWTVGDADAGLHAVLRAWFAGQEAEARLCATLASFAQQLTIESAEEGHLNLTEFLVGFFLYSSQPSLAYVSSAAFETVPRDQVRAIGGDRRHNFTQRHLPLADQAVDHVCQWPMRLPTGGHENSPPEHEAVPGVNLSSLSPPVELSGGRGPRGVGRSRR